MKVTIALQVLFFILIVVDSESKNDRKGPKKGPKVRTGSGIEFERVKGNKEATLRVDGLEVALKRRKFDQKPQKNVDGAFVVERDDCVETYSSDDAGYVVQLTNKCKYFKNKKARIDTPEESFSLEDEEDNGQGKKKGKAKKEDRGKFLPGSFGDDDLGNLRDGRSAVKSEALKLRNRIKRQMIPTSRTLVYSVIYDDAVYSQISGHLGTTNSALIQGYLNSYHTILFDLMEVYMLPLQNTRVQVFTSLFYSYGNPFPGCTSTTFMETCRNLWESHIRSGANSWLTYSNQYTDLWAFITGHDLRGNNTGYGLHGQADDIGSTCLVTGSAFGNPEPSSYMAELKLNEHIIWNTVLNLHETGHCIGIIHDNQGPGISPFAHWNRQFTCPFGYIMYGGLNYGAVPTPVWSLCSHIDYTDYLQYLLILNEYCLH